MLADRLSDASVEAAASTLSRLVLELNSRGALDADHVSTVAAHAAGIARTFGLAGRELAIVEVGAALHDLGKLCVRESVLTKPGPLTDEEWDVVRLHPVAGAHLLSSVLPVPEVASIVRWHHERWDGAGYPDRLAADDIPFGARIVAVADAYQAMVEPRPYRAASSEASARACLIECAGSHFDPDCVEAFAASRQSVAA